MPPFMCNDDLDEEHHPVHALFWNRVANGLGVRTLQGPGNETGCFMLGPGQSEKIIEMFSFVLPKYEAAILQIFDSKIADFPTNIKLCERLHAKFEEMNIPHCFITEEQAIVTTMLVGAEADLKLGEIFLALRLDTEKLDVTEYEYTDVGHKKIGFNSVPLKSSGEVNALLQDLCCKNCDYIFLSYRSPTNPWMKKIKKMFPESKLWRCDYDISEEGRDVVIEEMAKWMSDRSYTKYYVLPNSVRSHKIMNSAGEPLITVEVGEVLPLTKSIIVPKSVDMVMIHQVDSKAATNSVQKIEHKCHQTEIILTVDSDNFATIDFVPVMLPQIGSLRKSLTETCASKIPVIGFCDNFSVIAVHKSDEDGYKFVGDWNGIYGNENDISFCKKKPIVGKEALMPPEENASKIIYNIDGENVVCMDQKKPIFGASKNKPFPVSNESKDQEPGHVVYDLIKITSMPEDNIQVDDRWGFNVTGDDEHPVLLEFKTHDGNLTGAPPDFLMAILLKQHIKVIQKEMGEKPAEIGFCILDEKYSEVEKERIKKGLKSACQKLKIVCSFVNV